MDLLNDYAKSTLRNFDSENVIPTVSQFKRRFLNLVNGGEIDTEITIENYLENKISVKKLNGESKARINHLGRIKGNLKKFPNGNKLLFRDFDISLFEEFKSFLFDLKLEQNYVQDLMKRLRTVFRMALSEGIHKNKSFEYSDFLLRKVDVDRVVLSLDEIKKVFDHDFSEDLKLDRVRDAFIIQCDSGLRYTDLKLLNKESIIEKNNRKVIRVHTSKTDTKVYIPASSRVLKIIEKYDGFPRILSNQKMNEYLEDVCKAV